MFVVSSSASAKWKKRNYFLIRRKQPQLKWRLRSIRTLLLSRSFNHTSLSDYVIKNVSSEKLGFYTSICWWDTAMEAKAPNLFYCTPRSSTCVRWFYTREKGINFSTSRYNLLSVYIVITILVNLTKVTINRNHKLTYWVIPIKYLELIIRLSISHSRNLRATSHVRSRVHL